MTPDVQVCGITSKSDASMCGELGVDAVGFVNVDNRTRSISLDSIRSIVQDLKPGIVSTLITFSDDVEQIIRDGRYVNVNRLQLYSVNPEEIVKIKKAGFEVIRPISIDVGNGGMEMDLDEVKSLSKASDMILFEPSIEGETGGTGVTFDYSEILSPLIEYTERFGIAGGLSPQNVHQALKLEPHAVHVSSGVESLKGKKDRKKVKDFVENVRNRECCGECGRKDKR
ncbi:MAG: phosphoribosylanthranilate isomerase [Candidatus Saliniplasma sp.]